MTEKRDTLYARVTSLRIPEPIWCADPSHLPPSVPSLRLPLQTGHALLLNRGGLPALWVVLYSGPNRCSKATVCRRARSFTSVAPELPTRPIASRSEPALSCAHLRSISRLKVRALPRPNFSPGIPFLSRSSVARVAVCVARSRRYSGPVVCGKSYSVCETRQRPSSKSRNSPFPDCTPTTWNAISGGTQSRP